MLWINALLLEQETCYILCFRQDSTENVNWLNGLLPTALCVCCALIVNFSKFIFTSLLYYYVIFSFQYFSFSNTTYLPSIFTMSLWRYGDNFYVILAEKWYLQQRCTDIYIPLYPEIKNKGKYGTNTTSHQRNVSFPIIRIPPCRTYARVHTWADIQPISCQANIQQCTLFRPLRHPSPTLLLRSDSNGYVAP